MRFNILLFVIGAALLQQQAQLPNKAWAGLLIVVPVVIFILKIYHRIFPTASLYCGSRAERLLRFSLSLWERVPEGRVRETGMALLNFHYARLCNRHDCSLKKPFTFISYGLIKLFFLAAGFFWAAFFAQLRLADSLPSEWEGKDILITGVIASLPQPIERGVRFNFDVEEVQTSGAIVPKHITLSWYGYYLADKAKVVVQAPSLTLCPSPGGRGNLEPLSLRERRRGEGQCVEETEQLQNKFLFHAAERWQLSVRLKRPHGNANPHTLDYEAWLLEHGIRATGYVRPGDNRRVAAWVPGFHYAIERGRESLRERFLKTLEGKPYAGVLAALAIGDQRAIPLEQWQVFTRTGVNHLMSISGLHVTMLASLAYAIFYWLWRRSVRLTLWLAAHKAATLFGILAAASYCLLAGYGIPAQRTLYMLVIIGLALWLNRFSSVSHVLCWALFVVVLVDPWASLSAGFWLSFAAVAIIFYVSVEYMYGIQSQSGRAIVIHWLMQWGRMQWAITIGLIPLLLALFQQISIVSPLTNAIAIPVVSFIVTPLALLGAVIPIDLLLISAHEVMRALMVFLEKINTLSFAVWYQAAPPVLAVIVAIIGVIWVLLPTGFPARWVGVILFMPLFLLPAAVPSRNEAWVNVLDVGQGLAIVIQTEQHALVYDTGPQYSSESDSGSRVVVPFLRGSGIKKLDGLIVTHQDNDHSGGALSILKTIPIAWLASSLPDDHEINQQANQQINQRMRCYAGQDWEWEGVRFEMLHPKWENYMRNFPMKKTNDKSCVLKVSTQNHHLLLTGDIEKVSEKELLLLQPEKLKANIIVVPHHGSRTSSSEAFVNYVRPELAIFSVGYRNRFGHPKEEVVERYRRIGSRLLRTDETGAIKIRLEETGIQVENYREVRKRYWYGR